jgi:hypothetical protein
MDKPFKTQHHFDPAARGMKGATIGGIRRRGLLVGAGGLLAAPAIVRAEGQSGVALVIGNSKYRWEASLPNVRRDVGDIAKRFDQLGLRTELLQDVDAAALAAAIQKFGAASRGAKLAAVYFAGHGVFWEKQTYVVPVDADLSNPGAARSLALVSSINEATKGAAARLLVFDSCRNNPADGWRQREARSLAKVDAVDGVAAAASEPNTLLMFSTAPGGIALDGPAGENSPFASTLLRQLAGQSVDLQSLPAKMRRDLLLATECRQVLWDQSTYTASFVIEGRAATSPGVHYDPSRVVELPQVYAHARENGMTLPPGLVAYRPSSNSPDAQKIKIGSYKLHLFQVPGVIIVMSLPDGSSAECVLAIQSAFANGRRWRAFTAANNDKTLVFLAVDETSRYELKWRDQNSGFQTVFPTTPGGRMTTIPFARLDG